MSSNGFGFRVHILPKMRHGRNTIRIACTRMKIRRALMSDEAGCASHMSNISLHNRNAAGFQEKLYEATPCRPRLAEQLAGIGCESYLDMPDRQNAPEQPTTGASSSGTDVSELILPMIAWRDQAPSMPAQEVLRKAPAGRPSL